MFILNQFFILKFSLFFIILVFAIQATMDKYYAK